VTYDGARGHTDAAQCQRNQIQFNCRITVDYCQLDVHCNVTVYVELFCHLLHNTLLISRYEGLIVPVAYATRVNHRPENSNITFFWFWTVTCGI